MKTPTICGVEILGAEEKNFWKDQKGANINSIRTQKSIKDSDIVVVKFGEKIQTMECCV